MKILLAIDNSDCSAAATKAVIEQFRPPHTQVHVLHADEWPKGMPPSMSFAEGSAAAKSIDLANHATMFGDDELKSPLHSRFRVGTTLLWNLAAGLALEVGHTAARLAGRYDVAIIPAPP